MQVQPVWYTVAIVVLAAIAFNGLLPGVSATGAAHPSAARISDFGVGGYSSSNLAGYWNFPSRSIVNATVVGMAGNWTQPTVTCNATYSSVAIGVGMDGQLNTVASEQVGTIATCIGGVVTASAWFELLPLDVVQNFSTITVHPGDQFRGAVNVSGTDTFTMSITDLTTGQSAVTSGQDPNASRTSSECGVGRATFVSPIGGGATYGNLARFTKVHFSSCTMSVLGGYSGRIGGGGGPASLVMRSTSRHLGHRVLASTTIYGPGSFTVDRKFSS